MQSTNDSTQGENNDLESALRNMAMLKKELGLQEEELKRALKFLFPRVKVQDPATGEVTEHWVMNWAKLPRDTVVACEGKDSVKLKQLVKQYEKECLQLWLNTGVGEISFPETDCNGGRGGQDGGNKRRAEPRDNDNGYRNGNNWNSRPRRNSYNTSGNNGGLVPSPAVTRYPVQPGNGVAGNWYERFSGIWADNDKKFNPVN